MKNLKLIGGAALLGLGTLVFPAFGDHNSGVSTAMDSSMLTTVQEAEMHSDAFKKSFRKEINVSTVNSESKRIKLSNLASRVEDEVDDLNRDCSAGDSEECVEELREVIEISSEMNDFMNNARFAESSQHWDAFRRNINTLAAAHSGQDVRELTIVVIGD